MPTTLPRFVALTALAALTMTIPLGCSLPGASPTTRLDPERGRGEAEWPLHGLDAGEQRFSPLAQIDRTNVARLERAWTYHSGAPDSSGLQMQVNPIVARGVLYGVSPNLALFALDAATGEELWRFDPGTGSWIASSSRSRVPSGFSVR